MLVAMLAIANLPVQRLLRDDQELPTKPLLVVDTGTPPRVLTSSSRLIRRGMTLAQAQRRLPTSSVVPVHLAADQALQNAVLALARRWSPQVALLSPLPDLAYAFTLDRRAADQLDAAAQQLGAELAACLPGLNATLGIGPPLLVASLAAQHTTPGQACIVVPCDVAEFLHLLPVELLPIPVALVARLQQFGLHTIGAVRALPPAALAAQFGAEGARLVRLARGDDLAPPAWLSPPSCIGVGYRFNTPIYDTRAIATVLNQLTRRLTLALDRRGAAAGQLQLRVVCASREHTVLQHCDPPTSDHHRLRALLDGLLHRCPIDEAVERIGVVATELHQRQVEQLSLLPTPLLHAHTADRAELPISIAGVPLEQARLDTSVHRLDERMRWTQSGSP